jgi:FtsP/CotA-like multicopper oxidase with cupredoxin domain
VQPLPFAAMDDKYPMLNGRGYPDTVNTGVITTDTDRGPKASQKINSLVVAQAGQRVLLRISNLAVTRFYTLASTIPMRVVGHSARLLRGPTGRNLSYSTNSVTLGGGESIDVILDTAGVAPGTYLLYTTNLNYLSNDAQDLGGMMTEIRIQ